MINCHLCVSLMNNARWDTGILSFTNAHERSTSTTPSPPSSSTTFYPYKLYQHTHSKMINAKRKGVFSNFSNIIDSEEYFNKRHSSSLSGYAWVCLTFFFLLSASHSAIQTRKLEKLSVRFHLSTSTRVRSLPFFTPLSARLPAELNLILRFDNKSYFRLIDRPANITFAPSRRQIQFHTPVWGCQRCFGGISLYTRVYVGPADWSFRWVIKQINGRNSFFFLLQRAMKLGKEFMAGIHY